MEYINCFQITSLVLVTMIAIHYFSHKRLNNAENRNFVCFLAFSGVYVLLDMLSAVIAGGGSSEGCRMSALVLTLYYFCDVILTYGLFCYIRIITGRQKEKYKWLKTGWVILPAAMLLAVTANLRTAKGFREITDSVQIFRITGNCFLAVLDSLTDYEKARDGIEEFLKKPFFIENEKVSFHAAICGIMNAEKLEKEDSILSYIEYMISLIQNRQDTVLIQSDSKILEGFRYEQEVEHFLQKAVKEDLFEVYYQPVYSIKNQDFITLEALSRLKHPVLGMIPPDVFIGIAEKQGMISAVGCLQLHKVCRFIKEHEYIMKRIRNVKFNLSPSELMKPGYSHVLIGIIQGYGLDPGYFQFEITENVATEYSESFCTAIDDFAEVGIHMCLDDFGSGYANLNAVLRIPFSAVKMDRSLLSGVSSDPQTATFYRSIVMILQHMGYKVIAEGAETEKEVKLLEKWGVDMIQGYYFSRPLCEEKLLEKIS